MGNPRLRERNKNKNLVKLALKDGALVVTLKKKTGAKIGHALSRGDQKRASKIVANTGEIHNVVKLGRALEAAGHEDVEGRVVTALADCLTAMDTDKSPFEVEKETSQEKQNQEEYIIVTALQGRRGRSRKGADIRVNAKTTATLRDRGIELRRATRKGERKPRYGSSATEPTHALALTAYHIRKEKRNRKVTRRARDLLKATGVATPPYCKVALRRGSPLQFIVDSDLYGRMPKGTDNSPTTAEKAAERAMDFLKVLNKKTRAEKAADRRARLPDKVFASKAKSRAGQYYVQFGMNKAYSRTIRKKFKTQFSVVKPGTDGYYASTKAAAKVRDDWIDLKLPESWLMPGKK